MSKIIVTAQSLNGVLPPLISPLTSKGEIDDNKFRAEVKYTSRFPIGAVVVGAATGEGYALEIQETAQLVRIAKEELGDRVPVLAGVLSTSTKGAIAKALAAAEAGADGLMVTAPIYFAAGTVNLVDHFRAVAESSKLPLMIYNALAHIPLSTASLLEIAKLSGVVAIKEGMGGSLAQTRTLLQLVGDSVCIVFSQDMLTYPAYCIGARGSVASIDAVLPDKATALFDAVKKGDIEAARKLDRQITRVASTLGPMDWPAATKYMIELQGRPSGVARTPYTLDNERRDQIRTAMQEAGIINN